MTFRAIEIRTVAAPPVQASPPDLRWVAIDDIVVDDRYQRPLAKRNWKAIEHIARNFHWSRFSPVLLAPCGDGNYALIDGQHRTHAAAAAGYTTVPAMVVDVGMGGQAEAFTWVNGNVTAMTVFHVYKAGLAAGLDWALEMRSCVDAAGCRLMTYPTSRHNRRAFEVYSVGLVRDHVKAGRGAAVVTRGLEAMVAAGLEPPEYYSDAVLSPWFSNLVEWPDLSVPQLTEFLRVNDPLKLVTKAQRMIQEERYRHESQRSVVNMLLTRFLFKMFQAGRRGQ